MNMIAEMNSTKPSFESSIFNESPLTFSNLSFFLQQQNNQQSNSGLFFSHLQQQQQQQQQQEEEEEELEAPINIYHEHRSHLEEDKKSRTELDTEIADDELYCPVQQPSQPQPQQRQQQQQQENTLSGENFTSFLPRFLTTTFSTNNNSYNGIMESTNNDTWGCYHNDMFGTNNMFGGFDGINSVACQ